MLPMLQRRFICTNLSKSRGPKWSVKQVTKSNFSQALQELTSHLSNSDFIAISLQKTGSFSAPWHRLLPFDSASTAYSKSRAAADRFQLLQFAVCPFSVRASKIVVYPFNFHLFPRDELKIGKPSYSFSCQTSYLTSMAREGFDFNVCIYDGISYLSRAQESETKVQLGNPMHCKQIIKPSSSPSVADTIFLERIKSRVKHWRNACRDLSKKTDGALLMTLRKIVSGSEYYGHRPCLNIEVCSERQMQLLLEVLAEFSDDVVPLIIPNKDGGTQAVRVVLTTSNEDRELLEIELRNLEEERNKRIRGFREVIDLISASQKPVVSHNSLNDFTFVHSKFLSALPPNMDEFMGSLRLVFPCVVDINHLMMQISPAKKGTDLPAAISYLKKYCFVPFDMEIPQDVENEGKIHGQKVVKISHLFAKLCSILKIPLHIAHSDNSCIASALEGYANIFSPCSTTSQEPNDGDVGIGTGDLRKVSSENLVFLWGFRFGTSASVLKSLLKASHDIFSMEFDVHLVDKSCAILVFWQPDSSLKFLEVMNGEGICESLREMVAEGLRASGYETYEKACNLGLWETDLADSLDKALTDPAYLPEADSEKRPSEIYWNSEDLINLDNL